MDWMRDMRQRGRFSGLTFLPSELFIFIFIFILFYIFYIESADFKGRHGYSPCDAGTIRIGSCEDFPKKGEGVYV